MSTPGAQGEGPAAAAAAARGLIQDPGRCEDIGSVEFSSRKQPMFPSGSMKSPTVPHTSFLMLTTRPLAASSFAVRSTFFTLNLNPNGDAAQDDVQSGQPDLTPVLPLAEK